MGYAETQYIVQIHLKKKIVDSPDVLKLIKQSIITPNLLSYEDNPMTLSFVVSEKKPAKLILARYKAIADHEGVNNIRVISPSENYASSLGILDPVSAKLENAWRSRRERSKTEHLRKANGFVKGKRNGARRNSSLRGRRRRKPAKQSQD